MFSRIFIVICFLFVLALTCGIIPQGGGDSSVGGTLTGQVKFVETVNPILCSQYTSISMSAGTLHEGSGSMSTHDYEFVVQNWQDIDALRHASETGEIITIHYNVWRITPICYDGNNYITNID